jgi:transposase
VSRGNGPTGPIHLRMLSWACQRDDSIPLFQILEKRTIDVRLVNAHHVKNVPGRKTDVADCQWIQHLHACWLLRGTFRPDDEICAIRSLWRHRDNLIELATIHLQHMQKALDQMNVQLHHVISDLAGTTGLAIVDAILAGEGDPGKLAELRDWRIRASRDDYEVARWRLSRRASLHAPTVTKLLPALPGHD